MVSVCPECAGGRIVHEQKITTNKTVGDVVVQTIEVRVPKDVAFGPAFEIISTRELGSDQNQSPLERQAELASGSLLNGPAAELAIRDAQVRREEEAHAAVAGDLAGSIQYQYQTGPDGRRYAVGGYVTLDASNPSGDPARAQSIASRLSASAHAATNPSAQDLATARAGYEFASSLVENQRKPSTSFDV